MATTIDIGGTEVTILNAAERTTGRRGCWHVQVASARGDKRRLVLHTKREALRIAANCARAERRYFRRQRAAHAVFVQLPAAEQAALLVAMNTGRRSDRDRAVRRYEGLAQVA